jgi:ketosteroid isomerase-like protein
MPAGLIDTYIDVLRRGDVNAVLDMLAPDAVFASPYRTWRGRSLRNVYAARAKAFEHLRVDALVREGGRAVVLWRATVSGSLVEASEVVSYGDGTIRRVDVYLRPAEVLQLVYEAMVREWEATRRR